MTTSNEVLAAVEAVRAAVIDAIDAEDPALGKAITSSAFASAEVVAIPGENGLDHVRIVLLEPVDLEDLRGAFGSIRDLPMRPDGAASQTVVFDDTFPEDGTVGATLLADVESDGRVGRLTIRRDSL